MNNTLNVFTCYLTKIKDSQRNYYFPKNMEAIFYPLMIGCIKNNINLYIFHDNVSDYMINNITRKNKNIYFIKTRDNFSKMSNNDYRFKLYYEYIKINKNHFKNKFILFSDATDVFINKNPIDYMEKNKDKLIICNEINTSMNHFFNHYSEQLKILKQNINISKKNINLKTPLNAGVWGGHIDTIFNFLEKYVKKMEKISQEHPFINCNNLLLNIMCFNNNMRVDSTIFSPFKEYLFADDNYYIYHK
jgi:hypothetical protein